MKEKSLARVFGLSHGGAGIAEFDGEIVTIDRIESERAYFFHLGTLFNAHLRQLSPVELLYPNVIYVRDPSSVLLKQDEVVVVSGELSNCYARRGSHWVRYFIDPNSLIITDEPDEEKAALRALEVSEVIVNMQALHSAIKEEFPDATQSQILAILSNI